MTFHNLYGIVDTVDYGATTLHFSYQTLRYDLNFDGLVLPKNLQQIATIGASYDPGKWFVSGEFIRVPDEAFGLFYGGYVNDRATPQFSKVVRHIWATPALPTWDEVDPLELPAFVGGTR